MLASGGLLGSF